MLIARNLQSPTGRLQFFTEATLKIVELIVVNSGIPRNPPAAALTLTLSRYRSSSRRPRRRTANRRVTFKFFPPSLSRSETLLWQFFVCFLFFVVCSCFF